MAQNGAEKRHAACDECRTRKLKCSGEFPICQRCRDESIQCLYSPRKKMGRPRKRRREDEALALFEPNSFEQFPGTGFDISAPELYDFNGNLHQSAQPFMNVSGMNFESPLDQNLIPIDPSLEQSSITGKSSHPGFDPNTNGNLHLTSGNPSPAHENSFQYHPPTFSTPSSEFPLAKCSCLSDMYLTLSTLQTLPQFSFPEVLPTLRTSILTTHTVLNCPQCPKESTSAMQNIMLLTTLLTSITDCYRKLLLSIDAEAKRVDEAGEKKTFRMGDSSPEKAHLHTGTLDCPMGFYIDLNSAEWRVLARKVVKADVIGSGIGSSPPSNSDSGSVFGPGSDSGGHRVSGIEAGGSGNGGGMDSHQRTTILGLADLLQQRQIRWHQDPNSHQARMHFSENGKHCEPKEYEFSCLKMVGMVKRHVELLDL